MTSNHLAQTVRSETRGIATAFRSLGWRFWASYGLLFLPILAAAFDLGPVGFYLPLALVAMAVLALRSEAIARIAGEIGWAEPVSEMPERIPEPAAGPGRRSAGPAGRKPTEDVESVEIGAWAGSDPSDDSSSDVLAPRDDRPAATQPADDVYSVEIGEGDGIDDPDDSVIGEVALRDAGARDRPALPARLPIVFSLLVFVPLVGGLAVLFHDLWPGGWATAGALTLDAVCRSQVFFDLFEVFHIRFGPAPETWAGATVLFLAQLLLDVVFAVLVIQVVVAVWRRAAGLGAAEDPVAGFLDAVHDRDAGAAQRHALALRDALGETVDVLAARVNEGGEHGEVARQALAGLEPFASRHLAMRSPGLARQIQAEGARAQGTAGGPVPVRPGTVVLLAAGLVVGAVVPFFLPPWPGLLLAGVTTAVLGAMMVHPVGWITWLENRGVLRVAGPAPTVRRSIRWVLALLPLAVASSTALFHAAAHALPGALTGAEDVNYLSAFAFSAENLTRTAVLADIATVYHLEVTDLDSGSALGCLLTFGVRLVFSLGVLALAVGVVMNWIQYRIRGRARYDLPPRTDRYLVEQARGCGPDTPARIGFYWAALRRMLQTELENLANAPGAAYASAEQMWSLFFPGRVPDENDAIELEMDAETEDWIQDAVKNQERDTRRREGDDA